MLAWFKKKFGKKPAEPDEVQTVEIQETVAAAATAEPVSESPQGAETAAPAADSPELAPELIPVPAEVEVEAPPDEEAATNVTEPMAVAPPPEPVPVEEAVAATVVCAAESATEVTGEAAAEVAPAVVAPEVSPEEVDESSPAEQDVPATAPLVAEATAEEAAVEEEPAVSEAAAEETATPTAGAEVHDEVVPAAPLAGTTQEKPASKSLFGRLRERLGKTRDAFIYRLDRIFLGKKEIDQELFEQLEEVLITADLGVTTTLELLDRARKKVKRDQLSDPQALKTIIREEILGYIQATEQPAELVMPEEGPFVIMVVGVNGVGKTTSIGKIAAKFVRSGQSVLLVAGDTFRAAAINQLRIWGERVGVEVIAQKPGADPSSVVFDGLEYGVAHHHDVILIDTAGRLHTSVNLMEELKKIRRVIGKKLPGAPHEVMLVLDATTGQNGIAQAKMFHEAVGVSGLTLTKLDGTAKGGIVANVCRETGIPVRFIGIGEQIDDLRDFDAREFVDALFADSDH